MRQWITPDAIGLFEVEGIAEITCGSPVGCFPAFPIDFIILASLIGGGLAISFIASLPGYSGSDAFFDNAVLC